MLSIVKIIVLYFFIGFISDLILNYFSRQHYVPAAVKALEFYFDRKNIKPAPWRHFVSAVNAGLTIVAALGVTMVLAYYVMGFLHPRTLQELWQFSAIAFIVGYIMDILIYKTQLFGETLNPFYKIAGAGVWGALAFIFSILAAYVVIMLLSC